MIRIYFNKPLFEYDIHSLVKAFFPKEEVELYYTFAEEAAEERNLAVKHFVPEYRSMLEDADASGFDEPISAQDPTAEAGKREQEKTDQIFEFYYESDTTQILWHDTKQLRRMRFEVDDSDKRAAKNAVKRGLYRMISDATGQQLPWGTLTGIRPTKLAMNRLEDGEDEAAVAAWMQENYLTSEEKTRLGIEIAGRESALLRDIDYEGNCSLYVGIPFCPTTCLYCSFTSYPILAWHRQVDAYLDAVEREMDFTAERCRDKKMDTVYIGGGTPTTLEPHQMERLIRMIRAHFDLSDCREFTVEAGRPDSITWEKLLAMKENGIGRISVNPQTMKQETLRLIGRRHTVEQTIESFRLARRAGFDNINMDLILGLPQEDVADVRHTMEAIMELAPDSVTVHSLAVKRAARLSTQKELYQNIEIINTQEHMDVCEQHCRRIGLLPYYLYRQKGMAGNLENVGYAAPGREGLYNILMMEEKQSIMALGAGASTKLVLDAYNEDGSRVIRRIENVKDIKNYLERTDEMIERKAHRMDELGWR